ncbi:MAG: hypothetical protein ACKVVP_03285 [Chloroflexota bacterium]
MSRSVALRLLAVIAVAVPLLWRDAGPRVGIVDAHTGPVARAHAPLGQLLPEFRSARATMDRSKLLMSKVDSNKEKQTPRPASRPITPEQLQLLERIEDGVMRIRGLRKMADVSMELLDRDGLRDYLMAVASDTDVDKLQGDYLKLIRVLGLSPKDSASVEAMVETLADHILGFYSSEGKYMVLINSTGVLGSGEKATYAHEFTHALQDQHFDLGRLMEAADEDQDSAAAIRALIEGDATYAEIRWALQALSPSELWEFMFGTEPPSSRMRPSLDQLVTAAGSVAFTYGRGMNFVHHLHNVGGYSAINRAFAHPPTTTEQIFHPEKYVRGEGAMPVELPDATELLGPGWTSLISDSLGMLGVGGLIYEYADGRLATRVAEGWGGDKFSFLEHEDGRLALVLRTVWDTERDAVEFHNAMSESQRNRFRITLPALQRFSSWQVLGSPEFSALVSRNRSEVLVTLTSDESTARQVASSLGFYQGYWQ